MTTKSLMCVAALALAGITVANAKSYDVVLYNQVKAGSIELKAGEYSVKIKGDNAVFTSAANGKTFTVPVKLENSGPKHNSTDAIVDGVDGAAVLKSIKLGGSTTTLEFNQ